jgi:hypothetical protein
VAGAEVSAEPGAGWSVELGVGTEFRDTAEMCADADQNGIFGLDRAVPVLGIGRLLTMKTGLPRQRTNIC